MRGRYSAAGCCSLAPTVRTPKCSRMASKQLERIAAKHGLDFVERSRCRRAQHAGSGRGHQLSAHDKCGQLREGKLQRQTLFEILCDSPDASVAIRGAVGVEREARGLQRVEI